MKQVEVKPYLAIESELERSRRAKANIVVVSLPGLGMNHYLKTYAESHKKNGVKILVVGDTDLNLYNIVIWSRDMGEDGLKIIGSWLKKANPDQKFAVGVTRPWLLLSEDFKKSYLANHIYSTGYVRVFDKSDIDKVLDALNVRLTDEEKEKLMVLSGGIPQIVKYLAVNHKDLDLNIEELVLRENLARILETLADAVGKCGGDVLEKIGITDSEGNIQSSLLRSALEKSGVMVEADITVGFDLSLRENGILSKEKVTAQEKKILVKIIENRGKISKEEVSDIKWGEGKYEEYSDQAINKAMRRLDSKLQLYKIVTVPKVGYLLERR